MFMLWFLLGIVLLIFGLIYTPVYNKHVDKKNTKWGIYCDPRSHRPTKETFYLLKDPEKYLKDQKEWDEYNEKRKYYANLLDKEKKKYNIKSLKEYSYPVKNKSGWVTNVCLSDDDRFKWIFDKMKEDGVTFECRRGIDDDRKALCGSETPLQKDKSLGWDWLKKEALEYVHLDYAPYWNMDLIDPYK